MLLDKMRQVVVGEREGGKGIKPKTNIANHETTEFF